MRRLTDVERLHRFMLRLGDEPKARGRVYLTGGATAVLLGWRSTTIDVDIKLDAAAQPLLRAIPTIKEELEINVELAAPDDFLPELPAWRDRSIFIQRCHAVDFYHYDLYAQALSKIERGHEQDRVDVEAMITRGYVDPDQALALLARIEPELYRFPAVDPAALQNRARELLGRRDT